LQHYQDFAALVFVSVELTAPPNQNLVSKIGCPGFFFYSIGYVYSVQKIIFLKYFIGEIPRKAGFSILGQISLITLIKW
jgi:hypothetical protein